MAESPEEGEMRGRAEARFKETLRRPGYWSILRFVVAGLVLAAIVTAALQMLRG
jgi:hypothetical protein